MKEPVNEFNLIEKYLGTIGMRVMDIRYFREFFNIPGEAGYDIGATQGFNPNHQFFFGNVSIDAVLFGVINLADENLIHTNFSTLLYGHPETADLKLSLGVGLGMSLMGDGVYIGGKRLYGVGCNRISINLVGCGAAELVYEVGFNGYMFTVI